MLGLRRARRESTMRDELSVSVISVDVDDDGGGTAERAAARERAWRELRAIVSEAVIWQDAANDLLAAVSRREPLAELAPRGGPLVLDVGLRDCVRDYVPARVRLGAF